MKSFLKVSGFFLLCLSSLSLNAQDTDDTLYHRVGDTIRGRWPAYYYQWWIDEWIDDTNHHRLFPDSPTIFQADRILQYNYTNHPIKIIGIAVCCNASKFSIPGYPNAFYEPNFRTDSLSLPEYVFLYDAYADSCPLRFQAEWSPLDSCRHFEFLTRYSRTQPPAPACCDDLVTYHEYYPIREYYMEKPVTVDDSFYVGFSFNSVYHDIPDHNDYYTYNYILTRYIGEYYGVKFQAAPTCNDCESMPPHLYRFINTGTNTSQYPLNEWHWTEMNSFCFVLPIIEVEDSTAIVDSFDCPSVENFRVGAIGNGTADLLWNTNSDHNYYIMSYGTAGTPPDSGYIDTIYATYTTLTEIDSCTQYVAYLKAVCIHNDSTYSTDWNDTLDIYVCDTTPHEPIIINGVPERAVQLIPNPARTQVRVVVDCIVSQMTVYDEKGTLITSVDAFDSETTLDIKEWPSGVYIVKVQSPQGIIIRKLLKY